MSEKPFQPFVPANSTMTEFTGRALVLGLLMAVILGAANAYLGLKAGMTIAATYPLAEAATAHGTRHTPGKVVLTVGS